MKGKYQKIKDNNRGFSLIEMLVTVLVSSMVFATAVVLLSSGLHQFESVSTETQVQEECQIAQFFITELIQEASDFRVIKTGLPEGTRLAVEIKKGEDSYVLALMGDELRYRIIEEGNDAISQLSSMPKEKTFLAKNVKNVVFNVDNFSAVESAKYVTIQYTFKAGQKQDYVSDSIINLRNVKVN